MTAKTAIVKFNAAQSRWEATFNGQVLAKTSNPNQASAKEYLRKMIEQGFSQKARMAGVTKVTLDPTFVIEPGEQIPAIEVPTVEQEFSINERFNILEGYARMVANGQLASTLITGEGGLGKTFTVMRALRKAKLQDISKLEVGERISSKGYVVVKGYSTAKGLFRTLYENRNQIIVFDDCDSILRDPTATNLLKAALDSYDTRIVTWNAESFSDDGLPRSFEFTGGVIFISNMEKHKVPQAIRSRATSADVSMSRADVYERMAAIVQSEEFLPDFDEDAKTDALELIRVHLNNPLITQLNLRSLVNTVKIRAAEPEDWERSALYSLVNA